MEHVAHMRDMRSSYKILVRNLGGKRQLGRPHIDGKLISELILGK
jgi:hypothetical protein